MKTRFFSLLVLLLIVFSSFAVAQKVFRIQNATGDDLFAIGPDGSVNVTSQLKVDDDVNLSNTLFVNRSSERVGIGLSNPAQALEVEGSIGIGNNNGGTTNRLYLSAEDTNHYIYSTGSGGNNMYFGEYLAGGSQGFHWINTNGGAEVMTIDGRGNLGINTTDPEEKLVVIGNVNISGTLNVSGRVAFPNLANCDTIDTDANGVLTCGTDSGGGGELNNSLWNLTAGEIFPADTLKNVSVNTSVFFVDTENDRVGVGTESPDRELHVAGPNAAQLIDSIGGNQASYYLGTDGTEIGAIYKPAGSNDMRFWVQQDVMTLQITTANVGIGNTLPNNTLDVSGSGNFSGDLFAGSLNVTRGLSVGDLSSCNSLSTDANGNFICSSSAGFENGSDIWVNRIGINTSDPQAYLDINGSEDSEFIRLSDGTNSDSVGIYSGSGSPEGVVTAQIGSIYLDNSNGGLYKKEVDGGSSGWFEVQTFNGSNQHMAKMTRDAAQSLGNAIYTTIEFDNVEFATGIKADTTGNYSFNITKSGTYMVRASLVVANLDDTNILQPVILVNGETKTEAREYSPTTDQYIEAMVMDVYELNAGDYVQLWVYHNEGASQNTETIQTFKPTMSVIELDPNLAAAGGWSDTGDTIELQAASDSINAQSLVINNSNKSVKVVGANFSVDDTAFVVDENTDRVGVGTENPEAKLHVSGTGGGGATIRIESDSSGYANVNVNDGQSGGVNYGIYSGYPAAGDFTIRENTVDNRLTIKKTTGNIGIANTDPNTTLDVSGSGNFSGDLFALSLNVTNGLTVGDLSSCNSLSTDADGNFVCSSSAGFENGSDIWVNRIGINTSDPQAYLDINGSEDSEFIRLSDGTNSDSTGIYSGSGNPEGQVTAQIGSIYLDNSNGGLYKKEVDGGSSGWFEVSTHNGSNQHMAKMRRDSAQSISHATAETIEFDTVEFSTGIVTDTSGNYSFNITKSGTYLVSAKWLALNLPDADHARVYILVNGVLESQARSYASNANGDPDPQTIEVLELSAGDYVQMQVYQNSGGNINTQTSSNQRPEMSVIQIDPNLAAAGGWSDTGDTIELQNSGDDVNIQSLIVNNSRSVVAVGGGTGTETLSVTGNASTTGIFYPNAINVTNNIAVGDLSNCNSLSTDANGNFVCSSTAGFENGSDINVGRLGVNVSNPNAIFEINQSEDSEFIRLTDGTNSDSVGIYSGSGNPEGQVSAQIGSIYLDNSNGGLYKKEQDGGTAGWFEVQTFNGSNQHMAKMTRDAGQVLSAASYTAIEFDTINFSTGLIADTDNGSINITKSGTYLITATLYMNAADSNSQTYVYVNGESIARSTIATASTISAVPVTTVVELEAGDYINIYVYTQVGFTTHTNLDAKPILSVVQIDPNLAAAGGWSDTGDTIELQDSGDDISANTLIVNNTLGQVKVVGELNVTSPTIWSNGVNISTGGAGGGTFTNNSDINVTNFVANNTLFVNGSRVGIGTNNPGNLLHILTSSEGDGISLQASQALQSPSLNFRDIGGTAMAYFGIAGNPGSWVTDSLSNDTIIRSEGRNILFTTDGGGITAFAIANNSGFIGINTTKPKTYLDINASEDSEFIRLTDGTNSDSTGIYSGSGNPEGNVDAQIGSLYLDNNGGGLYKKEQDGGTAGWFEVQTFNGSNQHYAKITRDATQSITTSTNTMIEFDNVNFSTGAIPDTSGNYSINITKGGIYLVSASWRATSLDDAETGFVYILVNGDTEHTGHKQSASSPHNPHIEGTAILELDPGDYVQMMVWHNEGASMNTVTDVDTKPTLTVIQLDPNLAAAGGWSDTGDTIELQAQGDSISANTLVVNNTEDVVVIDGNLTVQGDINMTGANFWLNGVNVSDVISNTGTFNNGSDIWARFFGVNTSSPGAYIDINASEDSEFIRLSDDTNGNDVGIYSGSGNPEGQVTAQIGSIYLDNNGGGLYKKEVDGTASGWFEVQTFNGSNQHMARMDRVVAQSINTGTDTVIEFDNVNFSTGITTDTTAGIGSFNITKSGKYLVTASWLANIDSGELIISGIRKNGAVIREARAYSAAGSGYATATVTDVLDLDAGDYIQMNAFHSLGSAQNTQTTGYQTPTMSVIEIDPNLAAAGGWSDVGDTIELQDSGDDISANTLVVNNSISEIFSNGRLNVVGEFNATGGASGITGLVVAASGNVGIGTSIVPEALTVTGNFSTTETNNTMGSMNFIQYNSSCVGFRMGTTGGTILSCT